MTTSTESNFTDQLEKFLNELENTDDADLDPEEIAKHYRKLHPYGGVIEGADEYLLFSYTNLREKYMKRLLMTSLVGYLNRACNEWRVPKDLVVIDVYAYLKNPDIFDEKHKAVAKTEKNEALLAEHRANMEKRIIIKEFLEDMFQFNPDEQLSSAYRPNPLDKSRDLIDTPAGKLAIEHLKFQDKDFRMRFLENEQFLNVMNMSKSVHTQQLYTKSFMNDLMNPELDLNHLDIKTPDSTIYATVYNMIPSEDIFCNWRMYMENNYDALCSATQQLYGVIPDLDIAFMPYKMCPTDEEARAYQTKHKAQFTSTVYKAKTGLWNIVAPHKEIHESAVFLNDKTIVLEEIIAQQKRDEEYASKLMPHKAKKLKKKNIEEEGDVAEGFSEWLKENPVMASKGAEKIYDKTKDECPDGMIEFDIFRSKDGNLSKRTVYTDAEAPTFMENKQA